LGEIKAWTGRAEARRKRVLPSGGEPCGPKLDQDYLLLENTMSFTQRVLLSIGILLIDLLVFFLPLTALFLVYIILANPVWFRTFLQDLNQT
jgi:hypothetical protein